MDATLIKVAATPGVLSVVVAIVGAAVMPKDSPALGIVRKIAMALLVLAFLAVAAWGLNEAWR